jgi:hypothetical protein
VSIASPLMQPSPNGRRVGIRIVTFEACSGFTRVTAHRIAQPPRATFVTRLQPFRSPRRAARLLPDQSTTLWVDSSSTGDSRLRGALPIADHSVVPETALPGGRRTAWVVLTGIAFGQGWLDLSQNGIVFHSRPCCRARQARPMEISGRPMECYVVIDPPPMDDRALREWLELAVAFVQTLPAKPPKSSPGGAKRSNLRYRTRGLHRTICLRHPRPTA